MLWVTNWKAYQQAIHADEFDLVILDVCVPMWGAGGDGPGGAYDLGHASLLECRSAGYEGPVIFISSNPSGLDLGGDEMASAHFYNDSAGWLDAIAVVRADVSEMESAGEVGHG